MIQNIDPGNMVFEKCFHTKIPKRMLHIRIIIPGNNPKLKNFNKKHIGNKRTESQMLQNSIKNFLKIFSIFH